jgi:two-component system, OmpR family, response regulator MtrA
VGIQRVLVVDDEPTIRQLLAINLLAEGIHVASVPDGLAARQAAFADPPDLIILDVMMPGLDGLELLRELRGDPRTADVSVVLLTARTTDAEVWAGWAAGADYYLTKPFDVDELLDFIEDLGNEGDGSEDGAEVGAEAATALGG